MKWFSLSLGALAILAFSSMGCGSSSSTAGCEGNTDCGKGLVCDGGSCKAVACENIQECLVYGEDAFCANEGVNAADPETKYCSPLMCKSDADCDDGYVCDEFKQCVPGGGVGDDVLTPDGGGDDLTEPPPDTITPTGDGGCKACGSDTDCDAGTHCHPLGGGTFCFGDCEGTDDCGTGWMCYQLGNDGKQCVPMKFQCEPECLSSGCPEGQVCNQDTGACAAPVGECGSCQKDWECADGYRCYMTGHYCAPVCPDGACPTNGTCEQVNSIPMHLCVSQSVTCCYGDACGGEQCSPPTPFPKDGACVECLQDSHCGADTCGPDNTCQSANCPDAAKPYEANGQCVECLTSAHCDPGQVCNAAKVCENTEQPEECSYCQNPYPACTQINGVWSCVQCTDDSYCTGTQTCNTTIFACAGEGGSDQNCNGCSSAGDCVSLSGLFTLDCDIPSGCCYDTAGGCDGVEAFCPGGECVSLLDLLGGGGGGLPIPMEGLGMAVCSCEEPADIMGLMTCLFGACPTGGCAGGAACVDPTALLGMLGGGTPGTPAATGYCIDIGALLGGLLGP
ncbi:MAG: hypothetical protein ABIK09_02335 [Pseudomonadota bacterium]